MSTAARGNRMDSSFDNRSMTNRKQIQLSKLNADSKESLDFDSISAHKFITDNSDAIHIKTNLVYDDPEERA